MNLEFEFYEENTDQDLIVSGSIVFTIDREYEIDICCQDEKEVWVEDREVLAKVETEAIRLYEVDKE